MPDEAEKQEMFDFAMNAIEHKETRPIFIQGIGGCDKTTMAKKLLAAARNKGIICVGCASIALAATNDKTFDTAHRLFRFPVIEVDDNDINESEECKRTENSQRLELLQQIQVIIWDEFPSNHKEIFEDVYEKLHGFQGRIVICMGF